MKTRCKMVCQKAMETTNDDFSYSFYPVIPAHDDKDSENARFFKYTPSGALTFQGTNEHGFEVGKEYYVDISLAE